MISSLEGNFTDELKLDNKDYELIYNLTKYSRKIDANINKNNLLDTFFTFAYSLITILSLGGNTLIFIVSLRRKRMRIVTNFFLPSITVANLVYTICAPFRFVVTMSGEWVLSESLCTLLPFFCSISIIVNTLTLSAASIERFIVISNRSLSKSIQNSQSLTFIVIIIWICAIVASVPWFFILEISSKHFTEKSRQIDDFLNIDLSEMNLTDHSIGKSFDDYDQNVTLDVSSIYHSVKTCDLINEHIMRPYFLFLFIIQYALPLLVVSFTYTIICHYVYKINNKNNLIDQSIIIDNHHKNIYHNNTITNKNYRQTKSYSKNVKAIKILLLIIVCFNLCWLPSQMYLLIFVIDPKYLPSKFTPEGLKNLWILTQLFALSHFFNNTFINGLLDKNFKGELIQLFKCSKNNSKRFVFYNLCIWIIKGKNGYEQTKQKKNISNNSFKTKDKSRHDSDSMHRKLKEEYNSEYRQLALHNNKDTNNKCLLVQNQKSNKFDHQIVNVPLDKFELINNENLNQNKMQPKKNCAYSQSSSSSSSKNKKKQQTINQLSNPNCEQIILNNSIDQLNRSRSKSKPTKIKTKSNLTSNKQKFIYIFHSRSNNIPKRHSNFTLCEINNNYFYFNKSDINNNNYKRYAFPNAEKKNVEQLNSNNIKINLDDISSFDIDKKIFAHQVACLPKSSSFSEKSNHLKPVKLSMYSLLSKSTSVTSSTCPKKNAHSL